MNDQETLVGESSYMEESKFMVMYVSTDLRLLYNRANKYV